MFFHFIYFDGHKSSISNVQGYRSYLNTFLLQCLQNVSRKMQSGGWGGNGAWIFRVNSLVTFAVGNVRFGISVTLNVRGQGDAAVSIQISFKTIW